jgi:hypothetical protein
MTERQEQIKLQLEIVKLRQETGVLGLGLAKNR